MSSLEEDDLIATHMKSSSLEALVPFFRTRFSSMQVLVLCGTSSKSNLIDFELVMSSAAQFIVFREKRRMNWREILREKLATKNARKIIQKNEQKSPKYYVKLA